ncbi:MAG: tRNA epoxyqueuosine(34) reductase QueG [Verrucomicrobiota bacterium]|nr:tRNA epoxyqueuosine(34) reductase QueG [Verrucomicrobiota bacterium]
MNAGTGSLKRELVREARAAGFDSCRITPCGPPAHAAQFDDWLREGGAGEMDWLQRGAAKRADPQQILAGARSVIVLALNYWQGDGRRSAGQAARGRIARYAWGDDYHDLIEKKLKHLDVFLTARGGAQKCYVDTGPVLERDHADAAGVGWHGKSTMLVDRRLGTWFFLAEIFTTLDLAADAPQVPRCGTCTRCIRACPTGAITGANRLDARRCISYLTIELKGAIPIEFRPLIGDRIYGCDDCLEVCPWNRFAEVSRETAFAARPATAGMALRDYLGLSDADFRALFRGSPIKRIKRRGFLRNVCVALGNVGDLADLPALQRRVSDPEPLIAEHAQWAIDQIRSRNSAARSLEPETESAGL